MPDPTQDKASRPPTALLAMSRNPHADVARALDLCQGLKSLKPGDHVFVKPNLVGQPAKYPAPPYGVLTTPLILEGLLKALKDTGASRITVAEGGLTLEDLGVSTKYTMEYLGLPALAKRYDVTLLDLNEQPFREVSVGDMSLKVSEPALANDFFITLPVLKTHNQCTVSLGIKNLKGCLHRRSKVACHGAGNDLHANIAALGNLLYPDLSVIDGRYALAPGADPHRPCRAGRPTGRLARPPGRRPGGLRGAGPRPGPGGLPAPAGRHARPHHRPASPGGGAHGGGLRAEPAGRLGLGR